MTLAPTARHRLRALTLLLLCVAPALSAQQDPGTPREGFVLSLQPALVVSRLTGEAADEENLGWRRRQALQLRASYHLLWATSAFVELGASSRGARTRDGDGPLEEISLAWWDAVLGANVALRCVGPVCPSVDVGGAVSRRREAVVRDARTGRPLGLFPVVAYEYAVVGGVRLQVPRLRNVTFAVRAMEGLNTLATVGPDVKGRSVWMQAAVPLNAR